MSTAPSRRTMNLQPPNSPFRSKIVVAIPAKNEEERIGACIEALREQATDRDYEILVLVNNSADATAHIARSAKPRPGVALFIRETLLPGEKASAGGARRAAMAWAAQRAGRHGVLLTTDADGVVPPSWIEANVEQIMLGADAVAGRAVLSREDEESIPVALRLADQQECRYAAILDALDAVLDPDPADPMPRHDERSGASIAVTTNAFCRAGGIPKMAMGEDRAFFDALRRVDARIRHAINISVVVSARTEGRATGGMADTIKRRLVRPDAFLDERLEHARDAVRRSRLRNSFRQLWRDAAGRRSNAVDALANELGLPRNRLHSLWSAPFFGTAWSAIERESAILSRRKVAAADVVGETAIAEGLLLQASELNSPDLERILA